MSQRHSVGNSYENCNLNQTTKSGLLFSEKLVFKVYVPCVGICILQGLFTNIISFLHTTFSQSFLYFLSIVALTFRLNSSCDLVALLNVGTTNLNSLSQENINLAVG